MPEGGRHHGDLLPFAPRAEREHGKVAPPERGPREGAGKAPGETGGARVFDFETERAARSGARERAREAAAPSQSPEDAEAKARLTELAKERDALRARLASMPAWKRAFGRLSGGSEAALVAERIREAEARVKAQEATIEQLRAVPDFSTVAARMRDKEIGVYDATSRDSFKEIARALGNPGMFGEHGMPAQARDRQHARMLLGRLMDGGNPIARKWAREGLALLSAAEEAARGPREQARERFEREQQELRDSGPMRRMGENWVPEALPAYLDALDDADKAHGAYLSAIRRAKKLDAGSAEWSQAAAGANQAERAWKEAVALAKERGSELGSNAYVAKEFDVGRRAGREALRAQLAAGGVERAGAPIREEQAAAK